jgi:hypothetical protein
MQADKYIETNISVKVNYMCKVKCLTFSFVECIWLQLHF